MPLHQSDPANCEGGKAEPCLNNQICAQQLSASKVRRPPRNGGSARPATYRGGLARRVIHLLIFGACVMLLFMGAVGVLVLYCQLMTSSSGGLGLVTVRPGRPSWRVAVAAEADQLEAQLDALPSTAKAGQSDSTAAATIRQAINQACVIATGKAGWHTLGDWWFGTSIEASWQALHHAAEQLVALQSAEATLVMRPYLERRSASGRSRARYQSPSPSARGARQAGITCCPPRACSRSLPARRPQLWRRSFSISPATSPLTPHATAHTRLSSLFAASIHLPSQPACQRPFQSPHRQIRSRPSNRPCPGAPDQS